MIRYLQIKDGYIYDMISYPHEGYIQVEKESFPSDLHAGYWQYNNGNFLIDESLKLKMLECNDGEEY